MKTGIVRYITGNGNLSVIQYIGVDLTRTGKVFITKTNGDSIIVGSEVTPETADKIFKILQHGLVSESFTMFDNNFNKMN